MPSSSDLSLSSFRFYLYLGADFVRKFCIRVFGIINFVMGIASKMKKDEGTKENSNTSGASPGSSGFLGRMLSGIFGRKDTSRDSFFKRSFSNLFGSDSSSSSRSHNSKPTSRSKGLLIEEVDSDAEAMLEDENQGDAAQTNRNPVVELPEDQDQDDVKGNSYSRDISRTTNRNKVEETQTSVSFKRVTYGGINGAYYTATTSSVTNNGVTLEETKQADRSTGQATHRISRGIDGKGHSVLRKLNSDGKVDTTQILHNLNEDELLGFEKVWKSDADRLLHGRNGNSGNMSAKHGPLAAWGSFPEPFREHSNRNWGENSNSLQGKPKNVVTINIE